MAYDLFFRRRTPRNWSMHSYYGPRGLGSKTLGSKTLRAIVLRGEFLPDPTPTTPEEQQMLARLAVLRMSADAGSASGKKEWQKAMAKLLLVRKKAERGDEKSNHTMTILRESGIFNGVQSMSVTGEDAPLNPQPLIDYVRKKHEETKQLAAQGDPDAIKALARYERRRALGASVLKAINDDMVDRASKGDSEAKRWLVERDRRLPIDKKITLSNL